MTAPERAAETARQAAWREEIEERPARAARDRALRSGYKTPIWISANIHGDEWEGTDAALRVIEHLAMAKDPATRETLEDHRLYFSLTLNPDGRTHATRATSLGLDANRDMVTLATPEARSFVRDGAGGAAAVRGGLPRLHGRAPGGALRAHRTARTTSTTCSSRTATR